MNARILISALAMVLGAVALRVQGAPQGGGANPPPPGLDRQGDAPVQLDDRLVASGQGDAAEQQQRQQSALFRNFKPVTDAMLEHPDPADWLNQRRTLDGWGYSPLNQINRASVRGLQLVWSRPLGPGQNEPTPLVYNGVMYIPQAFGRVQAVNATTGDLVWEYSKKFETDPETYFTSRTRSIAMFGDKIYVATSDAHIVALSARTGEVVWDRTVADYKLGYRYTSGPIVVKGKVVAGITGCERYKDDICFISAHDPQTGKELWRTSTIARPGEPGGETWGDLPLKLRAGGDAWITGSYDPQTNLIYWSTAQAKPWAQVTRGTSGDALYTNSTLALDPTTGKIVWYYQFNPAETHDMDDVFENVLIDHDGRSSLFKMGKLGIMWELDRKTGKFVAAHDLGYQTLVEVDPQTGKVHYQADMIPKLGVPLNYCPGVRGIRNWPATAYHPETHALYIPIHPTCQKSVYTEAAKENAGPFSFYGSTKYTGWRSLDSSRHPASPQHSGILVAMDIKSGKLLWQHATVSATDVAALTTAGGLVVTADADGRVYFLDVATGKVLFVTRLPTAVKGYPVTYAVRGTQYIAIPTMSRGAPSLGQGHLGGSAIYVFALPQSSGP